MMSTTTTMTIIEESASSTSPYASDSQPVPATKAMAIPTVSFDDLCAFHLRHFSHGHRHQHALLGPAFPVVSPSLSSPALAVSSGHKRGYSSAFGPSSPKNRPGEDDTDGATTDYGRRKRMTHDNGHNGSQEEGNGLEAGEKAEWEAEEEEDDGLGYYPDGVKRTLTDEQIAMFRHSELHALMRERQRRREQRQDGDVDDDDDSDGVAANSNVPGGEHDGDDLNGDSAGVDNPRRAPKRERRRINKRTGHKAQADWQHARRAKVDDGDGDEGVDRWSEQEVESGSDGEKDEDDEAEYREFLRRERLELRKHAGGGVNSSGWTTENAVGGAAGDVVTLRYDDDDQDGQAGDDEDAEEGECVEEATNIAGAGVASHRQSSHKLGDNGKNSRPSRDANVVGNFPTAATLAHDPGSASSYARRRIVYDDEEEVGESGNGDADGDIDYTHGNSRGADDNRRSDSTGMRKGTAGPASVTQATVPAKRAFLWPTLGVASPPVHYEYV